MRSLLLALAVIATPVIAQETRQISASVTYLQRIAPPQDARVVYELRDANGALLLEGGFATEGRQVPIDFTFDAPTDQPSILTAAVLVAGQPAWLAKSVTIGTGTQAETLAPLQLEPYKPMGFATTWICGTTELELGYIGDGARMRIGAEYFDLKQAISASGAKYALPEDEDTWAWGKGNDLTVSLRGEVLGECRPRIAGLPISFTARGNEPGWRLDIDAQEVTIRLQNSADPITASLPEPEEIPGGRRYSMKEAGAVLTVTDGICRDTMTGMPHPASATLELEDMRMEGCAGKPGALLTGDEWTVEDMGGAGIIDGSHLTLSFEEGRVAGSAGCNRYFGGYELTGEGLRFSQTGSTMMACPEALMAQERKFHDLLASVDRFDISDTGALVLIAGDQPVITARR